MYGNVDVDVDVDVDDRDILSSGERLWAEVRLTYTVGR